MYKTYKCHINEFYVKEFDRVKVDCETTLFQILECYEPKKKKGFLFAVKPKWIDTNVVMFLSHNDSITHEYFAILNHENTYEGTMYLKTMYTNYYNKYASRESSGTSVKTDTKEYA